MSRGNTLKSIWDESVCEAVAVICCLFMIAGLFFSRALLSLSMFVMFANALHPDHLKQYLRVWRKDAFSLLSTGFFLVYLISGLWSENTGFWFSATLNKLPFVVLPFAFLSVPLHKKKVQCILISGLVVMQLGVIAYSLLEVFSHWDYYLQGYHFSRPIPTTKYNDHIRFSLSLVLSVFLLLYLVLGKRGKPLPSWFKWTAAFAAFVIVVYIHILAAKTGIICLYLAAIIFAIGKLGRIRKGYALVAVLLIALLPVAGYRLVPTFRVKMDYVLYEVAQTRLSHRYDYTLSDAGRMITYEIGGAAIKQYPLAGVGAGDVMDEMIKGYDRLYPEVSGDQRFGPINQFMFTALSVGIPFTIVLLALSLCPFFIKVKNRAYLVLTNAVLLISLMVESPLELQFGVFTYLFFILIWIGILRGEGSGREEAY